MSKQSAALWAVGLAIAVVGGERPATAQTAPPGPTIVIQGLNPSQTFSAPLSVGHYRDGIDIRRAGGAWQIELTGIQQLANPPPGAPIPYLAVACLLVVASFEEAASIRTEVKAPGTSTVTCVAGSVRMVKNGATTNQDVFLDLTQPLPPGQQFRISAN
jgi:hypothetical protein